MRRRIAKTKYNGLYTRIYFYKGTARRMQGKLSNTCRHYIINIY